MKKLCSEMALTSVNEVSLPWLDQVLSGHSSESFRVKSFSIEPNRSTHAETARIFVEYDGKRPRLPQSFFLKCCRVGDQFILDSEVKYYLVDYMGLAERPIPKCYHAGLNKTEKSYHLLLEDLTETHETGRKRSVDRATSKGIARQLARLHSLNWSGDSSDQDMRPMAVSQFESYIDQLQPGIHNLLEELSDNFSISERNTIREVFQSFPSLIRERLKRRNGLTLVHGDANPENILCPRSKDGEIYLIDRQPFHWSLRHYLGVFDLAYLIIPFWKTEDRKKCEKQVVESYLRFLEELEVKDYSTRHGFADYRLMVMHGFFVASSWCGGRKQLESMRWLWETQLRRSLEAFLDWDCGHILE